MFGGSALKIEQDSRHAFEKQQSALVENTQSTTATTHPTITSQTEDKAEPQEEFTGGPIVKATQKTVPSPFLLYLMLLEEEVFLDKFLVLQPVFYSLLIL